MTVNEGDASPGAAGQSAGNAGVTGTAGQSAGNAGVTGTAGQSAGNAGVSGAAGQTTGTGGVVGGTGGGAGGGAGGGQGGSGPPPCGPCPAADCKPGFMRVTVPSISCCPVCKPIDCALVDCAPPASCPVDSHLETLDGQCCPTCQPGVVPNSCAKGKANYAQIRTQLIEKYNSTACKVDTDCTLVFESNRCLTSCGTAFPVALASNAKSNLASFAEQNCATCPMPFIPPCAPLVALCSNGHCTEASAVSGP